MRKMFAAIAPRYDLNNRLHSLWQDQRWRRAAAELADVRPPCAVLDVACGTGDLTALLARRGAARVVGLDCCEPMLRIAREKFPALPIEWAVGDATALPLADAEFDRLTIAFGLRNLPDVAAALAEFRRVLAPGGRLVILEFTGSSPGRGPWSRLLRLYTERIMPRTAAALAGDRVGAYEYLHRSVRSFLSPDQLTAALREAGFADATTRRLTFGIATLHAATA